MVSIDEFLKFIDSLSNFKKLPNGDIHFTGSLTYRTHRKIVNAVSCEIRLHRTSIENGVITIALDDDNYVNEYQTRFDPNWHDYEFDAANKILVVSGNSIKLGQYKVEIRELSSSENQ
jgi:hypothetical protein